MGRIMLARGQYEDALELLQTCLHLRQATLPQDHWLLSTTKSFIGECYVHLGDVGNDKRLLAESYEWLREKLGPRHEQTGEASERMIEC